MKSRNYNKFIEKSNFFLSKIKIGENIYIETIFTSAGGIHQRPKSEKLEKLTELILYINPNRLEFR